MIRFNMTRDAGVDRLENGRTLSRRSFVPGTLKENGEPWRLIDIAGRLLPHAERWQLETLLARSSVNPKAIPANLEIKLEDHELEALDPDRAMAILRTIATTQPIHKPT